MPTHDDMRVGSVRWNLVAAATPEATKPLLITDATRAATIASSCVDMLCRVHQLTALPYGISCMNRFDFQITHELLKVNGQDTRTICVQYKNHDVFVITQHKGAMGWRPPTPNQFTLQDGTWLQELSGLKYKLPALPRPASAAAKKVIKPR